MDALFAATTGQGRRRVEHKDIQHHVDRIVELGQRLGLNRVRPEWNDGAFSGRLTSQTTAITTDNVCSLGRLTFGRMQPAELMVQTDQAEAAGFGDDPDQFKGPLAGVEEGRDDGYAVVTYFKLLGNGVTGRMSVQGLYELDPDDPAKLIVNFVGFKVEPLNPDDAASLVLWREALAEHNPSMDERGGIWVPFDKPPRGTLNYIVMDPEWHLALGGSGALTAMQRTPVRDQTL